MKFTHLSAFEKHLKSADPDHLSEVYLIADTEEYMQRQLAKKLLQEGEEWVQYSAEDITLAKLDELLNSYSMFSNRVCLCILKVEKLPKNLLKKLIEYTKNPLKSLRLIIGASSMSRDLESFAKEGVALDLTSEKPWDREKRLSNWVMQKLSKNNLRASVAICDQIVKMCGGQLALIEQEVEKLCCFLYGKKEISRADLDIMLSSYDHSIFKVGQALLDRQLKETLQIIYQQKFPLMMLIYSLRSTLQKAYRVKGLSQNECVEKCPQLKGYLLEKSLKLSFQYSKDEFKRMLQILFEVELLMKSQSIQEDFLVSLLLIKLGGVSL